MHLLCKMLHIVNQNHILSTKLTAVEKYIKMKDNK